VGIKTLILVRHAKSSWSEPGLADRLRPLNTRGERDVRMMGRRLAERGIEVERMISSPATRALATAEVIAEELGFPWEEVVADERLYGADAQDMLEVIRALSDDLQRAMLFGHNPGLTDLVDVLSPQWIENVPTCGVVQLTFDATTWKAVGEDDAVEMSFDYPKRVTRRE
jgi:phosphohistidine phosphatase